MITCVKEVWNEPLLKGPRLGLVPEEVLWEGLLKTPLPHPLKTMEDQMNHRVGKIGVDLGAILEDTLNNNNFSHAHHLNKILEDKIKEEEAITIKNIILVFEIHEINVYFATSKIYILPRRLYSRHYWESILAVAGLIRYLKQLMR